MSTVVDGARPANATVNSATTTYTKGNDNAATPNPTFDVGFVINQSAAETEINFAYEAATDNTADAAVPIIDQSSFWLATTSATTRF